MKRLTLFAAALAITFTANAYTDFLRNPVGETAAYDLDKSGGRTSGMIRSGEFEAKVIKHIPDHPDGPVYQVNLDYNLNISLVGRKRGTAELNAPTEYFEPGFLDRLRKEKRIELPQFTLTHKGNKDVRVKNGKSYNNTDVVFIDNINTSSAYHALELYGEDSLIVIINEIFTEAFESQGIVANDIEDLKILLHISEGTPVLGAVKIDISGRVRGFGFKAGFDLR